MIWDQFFHTRLIVVFAAYMSALFWLLQIFGGLMPASTCCLYLFTSCGLLSVGLEKAGTGMKALGVMLLLDLVWFLASGIYAYSSIPEFARHGLHRWDMVCMMVAMILGCSLFFFTYLLAIQAKNRPVQLDGNENS